MNTYCPRGCSAGRSRAILERKYGELTCLYCGYVMYDSTAGNLQLTALRGRFTNGNRSMVYLTPAAGGPARRNL